MGDISISNRSRVLAIFAGCFALLVANILLQPKRYLLHTTVETIKRMPMTISVRASGTIEAKDSSVVRAKFDAQVVKKLFREGQEVSAKDHLIMLDREKIRIDYQSRKDSLGNAQSDLNKARKEVRLQKALFAKQAVAYSSVDDAERNVVRAEQSLRASKESFRQAQAQWDSADVMSPIAGTIVKDWIGEEKTIMSGKEIFTVADVSEYSVRIQIDELDIKRVHEGQLAEIRLQSMPNTVLQAKVKQIGSAAAESVGSVPQAPVYLRLLGTPPAEIRPKLTAEARILAGKTEPILSVPLDAISNAEGETRVWTVDRLHRLRARKVEVGLTTTDRVEVTKGLEEGEKIATSAEPDFAEGMQIVIGAKGEKPARTRMLMGRLKEGAPQSDGRPKRTRSLPRP